MTNSPKGILAIWNDCVKGREAEFERWFQGEHLHERLAVPGFLFGRRHEAVSGNPSVFTSYVTASPEVLTSAAYMERLNNPTPLTRIVMSQIFANMSRTACRRVVRCGDLRGSHVVTARLDGTPDEARLVGLVEAIAARNDVACAEVWLAVDVDSAKRTTEEQLRGGDRRITGCLTVETLRQDDASDVAEQLSQHLPGTEIGIYRVLCQIGRSDL